MSSDVRLRDGDGSYRGRLEIRHTGEWGTVCNKNFNNAAASVVCHQLGYTGAYRVQSFRSGPAGGVIWLENVQCNGNEASLLECSYDGWGNTSCSHDDVGISCIGMYIPIPLQVLGYQYKCTVMPLHALSVAQLVL